MKCAKANKKTEKLMVFLRNSEFFNQQLFEEHPDGYYALDKDGRYVQVNKVYKELTGFSKKELYDLTYEDLVTKDCIEKVNTYYENALNGDIQNYQCTIMTKNHLKLDVNVTNGPIIVDNEILGIYGIAKDITKFNEQKCKLHESEQFHRSLVEQALEGIVVIRDSRLLYANQEALLLLGAMNNEEVIGKDFLQFIPSNHRESIVSCLKAAAEGCSSSLNEEKILQVTGNEIDVELKAIPTVFEGSPAIYLILRDITERKLAHELMINSEKLSVAGQLAAGIAHEIRNPITAIKGFLQLMEGDGLHRQEFFSVISAEIKRIELILSELLALAKPPLEHYLYKNVYSILQHVVALTKSQAILHNIHITTSFKEKDLYVLCDENKLKQVFINFIKNAIEAMPDGGNITVSAKPDGNGAAVINIADEGPGIPKHLLSKIGKPFFTTKENGTGLGVMVSYEIIKHHNGEVRIDSDSNGTTISVILPNSK
jgi:two-component system sporulation sensor kinase A